MAEGAQDAPPDCEPDTDSRISHLEARLAEREREAFLTTERLQAALDAQREVGEYLKEIHRVLPGALLVIDEAGLVCAVNEETSSLLGYSQGELEGSEASHLFDQDGPMDRAAIGGLVGSRCVYQCERKCRTRSGELIPVLFSAATWSGQSRSRGLVCVLTDLRERKRLEAELMQAQKLESVGRLAAGVAHEINTPVQFVGDSVHFVRDGLGELQMLITQYRALVAAVSSGSVDHEVVDRIRESEREADLDYLFEQMPLALERALNGMERVAKIVRSLKEFAHPDGTEKSAMDLNNMLESTLVIAHNEYKYFADVETDWGEIPRVPGHPGEINQVFLNIIVNAAHAIEDVVGNSGRRGRITVSTRLDGDAVLVSIADTGTGVAEAHRPKIFDVFFTTKPVGKGTGQGLALARSVITQHGGAIDFETAEGRGTTFFVRLPVVDGPRH